MADQAARQLQYEYKANSNLVLQVLLVENYENDKIKHQNQFTKCNENDKKQQNDNMQQKITQQILQNVAITREKKKLPLVPRPICGWWSDEGRRRQLVKFILCMAR